MWIFLFILCVINVIIGLYLLSSAATIFQQILTAFSFLYASIFLSAAGIIYAIKNKGE